MIIHRMIIDTPIGMLRLEEDGEGISGLYFECDGIHGSEKTPLLSRARDQLMEYFSGNRKTFDLPLSMQGTEFQKSVWAALCSIPYGETRSYMQIAEQIGRPKACRAVGQANHVNPIAVIVPCHRVVGASGTLTGYGGGLENKRYLLDLELQAH